MALADNLIAYYKLDESSGNASDSVNSNTLTNNNVTYSSGKINNGASFNGSSAYYENDTLSAMEGLSAFTLQMWFNQTNVSTSRQCFLKKGGDLGGAAGSETFSIFCYDGALYVEPKDGMNRGYFSSYASANTWTHLIVIFDGSLTGNDNRLKVYVNNSAKTLTFSGTIPTTIGNNNGNCRIGRRAGTGTFYFGGMMDEIALWSRAITSAEVASLYNSGSGFQYPFGAASGPAHLKTWDGVSVANIKTINGVNLANIKTISGVD